MAAETQELIGREEELAALVALLEEAQRPSRDIVIEGEAGIGKATLWRRAVAEAQARGFRLLACSPGEAEMQARPSGLTCSVVSPVRRREVAFLDFFGTDYYGCHRSTG